MPTAILIDGAFFIKRTRKEHSHIAYDPSIMASYICNYALAHLNQRKNGDITKDLYRIFFYDCPPAIYKGHNPISKKSYDSTKTDEYKFRSSLHSELRKKRKIALRYGKVVTDSWVYKPKIMDNLLKNKMKPEDVTEEDVSLSYRQKGVDMRIGLDIATLAMKKQVKQIILIAGDADFVPAAKLARREGIDFILDPIWLNISDDLFEHIDGLKSIKNSKDLLAKPERKYQKRGAANRMLDKK